MRLFTSQKIVALLAGVVLAGCGSPTGVDPVSVSLRTVSFTSAEQAAAWPSTPIIDGGESVLVRGRAYLGCGDPAGDVRRRGDVVGIEITAVDTDRMCVAVVSAWQAFEATVSGLAPGTYRVRVAVAGLRGRSEATVAVGAP